MQVALLWGSYSVALSLLPKLGRSCNYSRHTNHSLEMELGAPSWSRGYWHSDVRALLQLCPRAKGNPVLSILGPWESLAVPRVVLPHPEGCSIQPAAAQPRSSIASPLAILRHIPRTGLNPADGPPRPGQSILNQYHPKEFDVLALMEQVMNWEKPAILVGGRSHLKLLDSRH